MGSMGLAIWMPLAAVIALATSAYLSRFIMGREEGTKEMHDVSLAIREGADAYLHRQYRGVSLFFLAVFIILSVLARFRILTFFTPFAFVSGGLFSGLAGYIGMKTATASNARTAQAASKSLNDGLRLAFSAGSVMGLSVVGLALVHVSIWYFGLSWYYGNVAVIGDEAVRLREITTILLTSGMGASAMALFARVGGGIFTKAADVGADLVGKVEHGIPEDDPRNPAVIADNVGDNVGDVAGMGADLYESYVGSIVAAAALGVAAGLGLRGVAAPLILAAVGVIASVIGGWFVRTGEKAEQSVLLAALRRGVYVSSAIVAVAAYFIVRSIVGLELIGLFYAIISGVLAGILIGVVTEYYTSSGYSPTRWVSGNAVTGPATVVISGLSVGMMSTGLPILVVSGAVLTSYFLAGGGVDPEMGLFGISLAAVGMLSTLGITLSTDAYGPVADNAGGISQMSGMPEYVRERTDALDSLGNTTAATGKGFAIGSAALTSLALIAAYRDQVGVPLALDLLDPRVLIGLFIGAMLPFLFSALTVQAVGRAAQSIVIEVRRQFAEIKGLMEGKARPDYARCVDICTVAAQKEMVAPALLATVAPVATGILLGVNAVGGLLVGTLISGFLLAIMMANSGAAWDNAKKHIESGQHGGKGSNAHKSSVVGDTVGDPLKDTAGPSLNILIKLISMVAIVFSSVIVAYTLVK